MTSEPVSKLCGISSRTNSYAVFTLSRGLSIPEKSSPAFALMSGDE